MGFASNLADIWDWWLAELAGLPLRGRAKRPDIVAEVGRNVVRVRRGDETPLFEAELASFGDELARHIRLGTLHKGSSIDVVLEAGRALERPLAPFHLPPRRARHMAELDIQSSTPFDPAETLVLFPENGEQARRQRYFVVKRSSLEAVLQAVSRHGKLASLGTVAADGTILLRRADYRALVPVGRLDRLSSNLTRAALVACLIAVPASAAHSYWRYGSAIASLDAQVEGLDSEVKAVRALSKQQADRVARLQAVRNEKAQSVPLVAVWEEMTKIIPDTTWLSDLAINGDKVTFSGLSKSASDLIGLLEASPLFSNPTFSAPVVRAPDVDGERFSIEMRVDRT